MQTSYKMKYTEEEIPRGCRKPREVAHEETITIELREVRAEDAPVVLIGAFKTYKPHSGSWRSRSEKTDTLEIDYRWFENCLWRAYNFTSSERPTLYPLEYAPSFDSWTYRSTNRLQMLAKIDSWVNEQIIIDGQVWRRSGEPVYEFGDYSSYNHSRERYEYGSWLTHTYLSDNLLNDSSNEHFRLDEFDLAFSKLKPSSWIRKNGNEKEKVEEPFNPEIDVTFRILAPSVLRMNTERYWKSTVEVDIIDLDKHKVRTKQDLLELIQQNQDIIHVRHKEHKKQTRKDYDEKLAAVRAVESLTVKEHEEIENFHDSL